MKTSAARILAGICLAGLLLLSGCAEDAGNGVPPRGYMDRIEVEAGGRLLGFGPFVGYWFRPPDPKDLTRLNFVCYNEESFYTDDLPAGTLIFRGTAVLARLPEAGERRTPQDRRIRPVFFRDAPQDWLRTRPAPADEYRHFHSCYHAQGPARYGYWLRHESDRSFVYNLGGRLGPESPLYHRVSPGIDLEFPGVIEFDRGPER